MPQRLRRTWDAALVYLPAALLGVLALGSWWLVNRMPDAPDTPRTPRSEKAPEYFMRDFSIRSFDAQGQLTNELQGREAQFFPQQDVLQVESPRIQARNAQGVQTQALAQQALSNADGSYVQLIGDAVVSRTAGPQSPRMEIRGDRLLLWPSQERVHSDTPVQLQRGNDRFSADRLRYDHTTQQLEMDGRVRGTFVPRP